MSTLVLIETSAWTHALRRAGDAAVRGRVQRLLDDRRAVWCEMVRLELWSGVSGPDERRDLLRLDDALPRVPITDEVRHDAAQLGSRARAKGMRLPASDLLIFSCANRHGLSIEHQDKHYELLQSLTTT